jgi:hypothetical protein
VAVRNWLGLKPEERWWLHTMTAAATGYASQEGRGWRNALHYALTFGTDKDTADLRTLAERGQLPPRSQPIRTAEQTEARRDKQVAQASDFSVDS